jgi:hypothetical protein
MLCWHNTPLHIHLLLLTHLPSECEVRLVCVSLDYTVAITPIRIHQSMQFGHDILKSLQFIHMLENFPHILKYFQSMGAKTELHGVFFYLIGDLGGDRWRLCGISVNNCNHSFVHASTNSLASGSAVPTGFYCLLVTVSTVSTLVTLVIIGHQYSLTCVPY